MSDITVRREDGNRSSALGARDWEPARIIRSLLGWDPFREMSPYPQGELRAAFSPAFEVKETKESFVFKADVPGLREPDLEVNVSGNRLTVSGKREQEKQEQNDTYYTYERSYGAFTRSFTLPDGTDSNAVRADLKDGVLTMTVPKTPEAQPKRIPVKSAAARS